MIDKRQNLIIEKLQRFPNLLSSDENHGEIKFHSINEYLKK